MTSTTAVTTLPDGTVTPTITGTKGITTIEGQVGASVTAGIALLGALIALLYPADMGTFTAYAPIAASVVAAGLALSRSITKVGVVHALAIQAAALAANAPQVVHTVQEVDPAFLEQLQSLQDLVTPLVDRVTAVETAVDEPIDATAALDPALSPVKDRLEAVETKLNSVLHLFTGALGSTARPETPLPAPETATEDLSPVSDAPQANPGVAVPVATNPETTPTV